MKDILNYLNVKEYKTVYFTSNITCYLFNYERDKLIIAFKTNKIDEIKKVNSLIPKFKEEIQQLIKNQNNIRNADEVRLPISQFLWDLYLICFLDVSTDEEKLDQKIMEYERDRYISRKIVLKCNDINELKVKYEQLIFPHLFLDDLETEKSVENGENKKEIKINERVKYIKNYLDN